MNRGFASRFWLSSCLKPFMIKSLLHRNSLSWISHKNFGNQVLSIPWNIYPDWVFKRVFHLQNIIKGLFFISSLKWSFSTEHYKHYNAKWPYIYLHAITFSQHLRRYIKRCSHSAPQFLLIFKFCANSKINYLNFGVGVIWLEKYVLWFQISMYYIHGVQVIDSRK